MPDKKTQRPEEFAEEEVTSEDKGENLVEMSLEDSASVEEEDTSDEGLNESEVSDEESKNTDSEIKDQLLRALAEVENMRRRSERDVAQANKYGHLAFARDLLSCFDNLSQAIALAPEDKSNFDENLKNILVGVEMISNEIDTILQRHHITKINPIGEKFDYNHHQAMFEVPNDDVEVGTVVQVAQPGYLLHDRLIRPAMVGVSKKTSSTDSKEENSVDKQA
tara:strand:+ start:426 stop:1091 length:666 start_codon:yes stop_codon:yes gene_type:complete